MKDLTKRPGEVRYYTFKFDTFPEIVDGELLTGTPTVTISLVSGEGSTPTISGATVASGNQKVTCLISGGTDSGTWLVSCSCATNGGSTLVLDGLLEINDR